eukprot:6215221-Amphidinium_carterae.1
MGMLCYRTRMHARFLTLSTVFPHLLVLQGPLADMRSWAAKNEVAQDCSQAPWSACPLSVALNYRQDHMK